MEKNFTLIVHIGAGKTGTSSIQASLLKHKDELRQYGWDYWGLMLERVDVLKYAWQRASGSKMLMDIDPDSATEQLFDVLSENIKRSISNNINHAIWSNESFFGRHDRVISALRRIESTGVRIKILCYVRNHVSWAKSAYVQWGLKHKSYQGKIIDFKSYMKRRPVGFYGSINPWMKSFPDDFMLKNYDVAIDIVSDFSAEIQIPVEINSVRVNETPLPEELLLRAIFNNSSKREVLPVEFDLNFLPKRHNKNIDAEEWMGELLPKIDDLVEVAKASNEDLLKINQLLQALGQVPLEFPEISVKPLKVNSDIVIHMMLQIIVQQSRNIQEIQSSLDQIKNNLSEK